MRIVVVAITSVLLQMIPASAQSFAARWSLISEAHAGQPQRAKPAEPTQQQPPITEKPLRGSDLPESQRTFYGMASFYSYRTGETASGSGFDREAATAAHRSLPFGTRLRVTNLAAHRSVIVTVTDRGPRARGRVIDVSLAAARILEMTDKGVVKVRVEIL